MADEPVENPAPKSIPVPEDFAFTWAESADAERTWDLDGTHFPEAIPPLEFDFWHCAIRGIYHLEERLDATHRISIRYINGYFYMGGRRVVAEADEEQHKKRGEQAIQALAGEMHALWPDEWLPEIEDHLAFWDAFDLEGASLEALRLHLDESWRRVDQIWTLHFTLGPPAYAAMEKFKEYYGELFEDNEDELAAYRLLEGLENKTVEMGHALWDLSRDLAPDVAATISGHAAAEVVPALKKTEGGRAFLVELEAYLAEYGQRSNHWSLSLPGWAEDPTPVCKNLQDYLRSDSDPRLKYQTLATERERELAVVRERLQGYPQPARDEFEERLKQAQLGMIISEDHNFWIDFASTYKVRRAILALGRRLAEAGWIETADDVFYLHWEEVRQLDADQRALVAERKQWLEHYRQVKPPPRLGVEPPPKKESEDEEQKPEPPADEPGVLRGQVGAPGKVRGRARVVESVASAEGLEPGDILVAPTTSSSWTPLFASLGGVVAEQGGLLSHCAVVAREYRIPAVIGLANAREKIADGQLIEVDGAAGTVRLVEAEG